MLETEEVYQGILIRVYANVLKSKPNLEYCGSVKCALTYNQDDPFSPISIIQFK